MDIFRIQNNLINLLDTEQERERERGKGRERESERERKRWTCSFTLKLNNLFSRGWLRYLVKVLTFQAAAYYLNLQLPLYHHRRKLLFGALVMLKPQWQGTTAKHSCRFHPFSPSPAGFTQTLHEVSSCWNVTSTFSCVCYGCAYPQVNAHCCQDVATTAGAIFQQICVWSAAVTQWSNAFAGMIIRFVAGAASAKVHLDTEHRRL